MIDHISGCQIAARIAEASVASLGLDERLALARVPSRFVKMTLHAKSLRDSLAADGQHLVLFLVIGARLSRIEMTLHAK
jgi:hypothetical protein